MIWIGGHRGLGCTDHPFFAFRDPEHRPVENTTASITAAFLAGADFVEIDVVMTADGVPLVLHSVVPEDHFFGPLRPVDRVNRLTARTLLPLSVGRHQHGILATLEEMLLVIKAHDPHTAPWGVNIEIKGTQHSSQPWDGETFIDILATCVARSSYPPERILWSSFCFQNIHLMARCMPSARYGMLFAPDDQPIPLFSDHRDEWEFAALPFDRVHWAKVCAHGEGWLTHLHPELTRYLHTPDDALRDLSYYGHNIWILREKWDPALTQKINEYRDRTQQSGRTGSMITDEISRVLALGGTGPHA